MLLVYPIAPLLKVQKAGKVVAKSVRRGNWAAVLGESSTSVAVAAVEVADA